MALFKPNLGSRENLPVTLTAGWAYFCTDSGEFFVDYADASGVLHRKQINAEEAKRLIGYDVATSLNASNSEIPTSQAVATAIKAANIIHIGPDEPTDPNIKIWINTSEEGTGVIPVLPRVATITLASNAWDGNSAPYSQVVEIATVTSATKIELNPTVSQILSLQNDDIALMAENDGLGIVTIYSFGGKPSADMTMQVTLQEVAFV